MAALEAALARAQRNHFTVAVAFIDLDKFKQANDNHGHAAGDIVLVEVANRLAAQARSGDFYARLGGDEFVIIAENLDDLDAARSLANRVGAAIAEPVTIGEIEIAVGASIGVAFSPEGVIDADALLAHADPRCLPGEASPQRCGAQRRGPHRVALTSRCGFQRAGGGRYGDRPAGVAQW